MGLGPDQKKQCNRSRAFIQTEDNPLVTGKGPVMAFQRAFLAARQALTVAHTSNSRQYAAMSAGALARSFHKGCTKACSQSVCCRGLAGPAGPAGGAGATTAAAGAGAGAGKKSKPFYRRLWFRAAIYISGGAVVYSLVDSAIFHPRIENEVSFCPHQ
jgi:hypothetical protein